MAKKICSVDCCSNPARSESAEYCEKHYYRMRRNGTLTLQVDANPPPEATKHSEGYVLQYVPGHPLQSSPGRRVYQHRVAFYDERGAGPFECHVCGSDVTWSTMHVDHLNDVVDDNRIENLAPACPTCNQSRGSHKMASTNRAKSDYQITFNGTTKCLAEWARDVGISNVGLRERLRRGWSVDRALTTPPPR